MLVINVINALTQTVTFSLPLHCLTEKILSDGVRSLPIIKCVEVTI